MTEAIITLCLLSFTWLVTVYLLSLAENRVRCASIGRHVAWTRAHAPSTFVDPATQLSPFFIRHTRVVTPAGNPSVRSVPITDGNIDPDAAAVWDSIGLGTIQIQHVEQRLNINNRDDTALYKVDQREMPLMQEAFEGVGRVGIATCEWVTVDTILESRAGIIANLTP